MREGSSGFAGRLRAAYQAIVPGVHVPSLRHPVRPLVEDESSDGMNPYSVTTDITSEYLHWDYEQQQKERAARKAARRAARDEQRQDRRRQRVSVQSNQTSSTSSSASVPNLAEPSAGPFSEPPNIPLPAVPV